MKWVEQEISSIKIMERILIIKSSLQDYSWFQVIILACGIFFKTRFFHVTCVLSQNLIRKTLKENQKNDSCVTLSGVKTVKHEGGSGGRRGLYPINVTESA